MEELDLADPAAGLTVVVMIMLMVVVVVVEVASVQTYRGKCTAR